MQKDNLTAIVSLPFIVIFALVFSYLTGQHSYLINHISSFLFLTLVSFALQWFVFTPSYIFQTEKYFDITGTLTYISLTVTAVILSPKVSTRSILLLVCILIWTLRLGSFLFHRVHKAGKDGRFDALKPSFFRFLNVWTLQGLWVILTASAALIAMTSLNQKPVGVFAIVGALIWLCGLLIEVIADNQKSRFKQDPQNKHQFIQSGLWALSRHPNYLGEIVLWIGIAIISCPVFRGWQWLGLISPIFVFFLLVFVSGIPLLEKRADEKWGGQDAYETYKQKTPLLILKMKWNRK